MKKSQSIIIILIFFTFLYLSTTISSEGENILSPLYAHSESNVREDYKLSVSVNSQILKWDSILALKISLINTSTNKIIPNSSIGLKVYIKQILYVKINVSFTYYLIYDEFHIRNKTKNIMQYISHLPSFFPYFVEATYKIPSTNDELTISFPILILSDRKPMLPLISFEMFIIIYFLALGVISIIVIFNKKVKQSDEVKKNENVVNCSKS